MTTGERVKYIRKSKGLTGKEFSESLGISPGHLSKIEHGQHQPSDTLLMLVRATYGVDSDWIRTGEGEMTAAAHGTQSRSEEQPCSVPTGSVGDLLKKAEQILRSENTEAAAALAVSIAAFHGKVSKGDSRTSEPDELGLIEMYRKAKKLNAAAARAIIDFAVFRVSQSQGIEHEE